MSDALVFGGTVNEAGRIAFDDRAKFDARLRKLAGKRVEVIVRKPASKRSLQFNAYLHHEHGPVRLLADYFGDSIEATKYALMGEFTGWVKSGLTGRTGQMVPVKAHTSDLTREESGRFIDWVIPFGAGFGVLIPLPNEIIPDWPMAA